MNTSVGDARGETEVKLQPDWISDYCQKWLVDLHSERTLLLKAGFDPMAHEADDFCVIEIKELYSIQNQELTRLPELADSLTGKEGKSHAGVS